MLQPESQEITEAQVIAPMPQLRPRPAEASKEELEKWKKETNDAFMALVRQEIKNHSVPLILIAAFIVCPPIIFVWVPFVMLFWGCQTIYDRLGIVQQKKILNLFPQKWKQSRFVADLIEGMAQVRPFLLASLYIFCIPFALSWMYIHWLLRLNKGEPEELAEISERRVSFLQNRSLKDEQEEVNFFHSPAFSMSAVALFVSGIPAALTYLLYQFLGIDALMGFPSLDPRFKTVFVIIGLYFGSVAWCGSILFFRSWFTFPLNFADNQERIELNETGIRRKNQSWFSQVLTWNSPWKGPDSLNWAELKSLTLDRSYAPLYPLPATAFAKNSLTYFCLNQLALLVDGLQKNGKREQYIYFSCEEIRSSKGMMDLLDNMRTGGRTIRINISELSEQERAQLIYSVKKWAPELPIDEAVHTAMMGSNILQAPAYTQLWFDLLTDKMPLRISNILPVGTKLDKGALTVKERLSSGGQANIYIAESEDAAQCVLKEFILSNSEVLGALVASASEFEMEASLLTELQHPRIIKMKRFFTEARRLYIVLEKVDGPSLRQLVKTDGKPMREEQVVDIALQICEALEFLHAQVPAVVHRDISPDNLLLSSCGIKLIDFSLAASKKSLRTSSTMGKHSYAPPEQFKEQVCPQSDIYGLGATIYYLLIGEDPKPLAPQDVREKRPELSKGIADIVKQATAFELEDRYPSVEWLANELRSLQKLPEG